MTIVHRYNFQLIHSLFLYHDYSSATLRAKRFHASGTVA